MALGVAVDIPVDKDGNFGHIANKTTITEITPIPQKIRLAETGTDFSEVMIFERVSLIN